MILHCSQQNLSKTSQRPLMDHLRCCNPDAVSVLSTSCTRSSRVQKECKWGVLCSCLLSGPEYLLKSELAFVSYKKLGAYEHPHPLMVMQCLFVKWICGQVAQSFILHQNTCHITANQDVARP